MKIAVDLDGVCYEWERTARYMLREYLGAANQRDESEGWDSIKHRALPEDWKWLWTEGIDLGLFRHGHVTTGAIVGLKALTALGHKVHFVTHRPESAVQDTIGWVNYHMQDIPYVGLTILSNMEPKSIVKADVLIDDKAQNIEEWPWHGILFSRPWNRGAEREPWWPLSGAQRAIGWKGVVHAVRSI